MQYSSIVFTILAASGAVALPQNRVANPDTTSTITLESTQQGVRPWVAEGWIKGTEVASATSKTNKGPFTSVNLNLAANIQNKELRCKVLNEAGAHVVVKRGTSIDHTFADGDKGKWTIASTIVSKLICDPKFKKIAAEDINIVKVILDETSAPAQFSAAEVTKSTSKASPKSGTVKTVTLLVGPGIEKQTLRCQALNKQGKPLRVQRGENKDTSFGDAGKGKWTFLDQGVVVDKIVCDPSFVKAA